jgi:cytochrome c biogenesis factor
MHNEGVDAVVRVAEANAGGRWEVVAVAVLFMAMVGVLGGVMLKLWNKVNRTDVFIQDKLVTLITVTNSLLQRASEQEGVRNRIVDRVIHLCEEMLAVFTTRPCLVQEERLPAVIRSELTSLKEELMALRRDAVANNGGDPPAPNAPGVVANGAGNGVGVG